MPTNCGCSILLKMLWSALEPRPTKPLYVACPTWAAAWVA
jgi:hypothetical protein